MPEQHSPCSPQRDEGAEMPASASSPGCSAPTPATLGARPATRSTAPTWRAGQTGPVGRLRSADPDRLRQRPSARRAARSARSACRSAISATCGRCSTASRSSEMNTSMTINATAAWLLALYVAVAERAGRAIAPSSPARCRTTSSRNISSRGTYIFPPAPSLRLIADVIAFTYREMPQVEPDQRLLLPPAGGGRDAGAGAGLRARHRHRGARHGPRRRAGAGRRSSPRWSGASSFFVNAGMRFVTEMCKMRAFAELWDEISRERYGVDDPSSGASATACRSTRSG